MRTTLDLDDALLIRAKAEAAKQRTTLTRLIEEGLALRLAADDAEPRERPSFRLHVFHGQGGLRPGIDPCSNASLLGGTDEHYDRRQAGGLFDDPPDDDGAR
jgi:hypothetical protein